jgi:hypothetical protein
LTGYFIRFFPVITESSIRASLLRTYQVTLGKDFLTLR